MAGPLFGGQTAHFELSKSTDQTSLGASTWYKITWDGTASSASCTVDLANNDVDITESGDYIISIQLGSTDIASSSCRVALYTGVTGSETIEGDYTTHYLGTGNQENISVTEKYTLTAPETVSAYVWSADASWSIESTAKNNFFPICKFSAFKIPGT